MLPVIEGLAFDLPEGTFTCLIGPSGCGKTTVLRILLGLDGDYRGGLSPGLRQARQAAVFQEPRLLPWRSVAQNVRLARPEGIAEAELAALLDAVGLAGFRDSYPAELSLGMARRAALARAFAVRPELLILDEPFVSLDEPTAARLRELLTALWRSRPMTVLMVTHNLREALRLADRLIVLGPRPTRVLGMVEVPLAREARRGAGLDELAAQFNARFPGLTPD